MHEERSIRSLTQWLPHARTQLEAFIFTKVLYSMLPIYLCKLFHCYSKLHSMCYNTRPTEVQFSETYPLQSAICMYVQSTVYTQIYIQIYIFVNREDGAW